MTPNKLQLYDMMCTNRNFRLFLKQAYCKVRNHMPAPFDVSIGPVGSNNLYKMGASLGPHTKLPPSNLMAEIYMQNI